MRIIIILLLLLLSLPAVALQPLLRLNVGDQMSAQIEWNFETLEYRLNKMSELTLNIPQILNLRMESGSPDNQMRIIADKTRKAPTPDSPIKVMIPDVGGATLRTRSGAFWGGNGKFTLYDGIAYWNRTTSTAMRYTAYVYAIWTSNGIVWALAQSPIYTQVETTTTATDINYMLLEDGSQYTRKASDYCICVGRVEYLYNTSGAPDNLFAGGTFRVLYKPEDFEVQHHNQVLANTVSASGIAFQSILSQTVLWSGTYFIVANMTYATAPDAAASTATLEVRVGGTAITHTEQGLPSGGFRNSLTKTVLYDISAGEVVYMYAGVTNGGAGTCYIFGNNDPATVNSTNMEMLLLDRKKGIWY